MRVKMDNKLVMCVLVTALAAGYAQMSNAEVSADEAAKLKTVLTPLGGEKAGNKGGTIPEWNGGVTKADAAKKKSEVAAPLFADEKPLMKIDASNMAQYSDKLSEGTKALMAKYSTFSINVFPTHRTAASPDWVAENTFKNATDCKLSPKGMEGCYGGIPFPIPKSGLEVIWNYLLRVEPESMEVSFKNIIANSDGSQTMATRNDSVFQFPYYYKDGSAAKWNGEYYLNRFLTKAPPFKVGESLVLRDNVSTTDARQAWQYLVGQRRTRRAPTVGYDTPDFVASGANYFDEVLGFLGDPYRYDWKIVGKKEMYVPYNVNNFLREPVKTAVGQHHLNSETLRWELHRVWEVEATVKNGKRHAVPKRKFYFDEDTYLLTLHDGFDSKGKIWRTSQMLPFVEPSIPANVVLPVAIFNLQAGTMSLVQFLNDEHYNVIPRGSENYYTGDALASDASR